MCRRKYGHFIFIRPGDFYRLFTQFEHTTFSPLDVSQQNISPYAPQIDHSFTNASVSSGELVVDSQECVGDDGNDSTDAEFSEEETEEEAKARQEKHQKYLEKIKKQKASKQKEHTVEIFINKLA